MLSLKPQNMEMVSGRSSLDYVVKAIYGIINEYIVYIKQCAITSVGGSKSVFQHA